MSWFSLQKENNQIFHSSPPLDDEDELEEHFDVLIFRKEKGLMNDFRIQKFYCVLLRCAMHNCNQKKLQSEGITGIMMTMTTTTLLCTFVKWMLDRYTVLPI